MLQAATAGSSTANLQPGCPSGCGTGGGPPVRPALTTDQVEMDTSAPAPTRAAPPITEDFLLRSLKLNTEHIIKSFTSHVNMLSQRVDNNASLIAENASSIASHAA